MSAQHPDVVERQLLKRQLDEAVFGLDTDGLRFVTVVAMIRGLSAEGLEKLCRAIGKPDLLEGGGPSDDLKDRGGQL